MTDLDKPAAAALAEPPSMDIELAVTYRGVTHRATRRIDWLALANPERAYASLDVHLRMLTREMLARLSETALPTERDHTTCGDYASHT